MSFERDIAPVLLKQCQSCHGPDKAKGRYRLDSFQRLMTPGKSKSAPIVPGEPGKSELFQRLTAHDDDERMPQDADPLPAAQTALIRKWIEQGGKFDGPDPGAPLASLGADDNPAPPAAYPRPVPITAVAFSPDGHELAASGYHEVTIWDAKDGKLLRRIQNLPERIWGLAYQPNGKWLAIAAGNPGTRGELALCDPSTSDPPIVLEKIADMMLVVRFSPDGSHLAAGGADNAVRVFDMASRKRTLLIEQHADWVTDLAFSPDGSKLVTASRDKSARVFDAQTGSMESAYLKHEEAVLGVAWAEDGKTIFSAGRDRKLDQWKASDGKDVGEIAGFNGDPFKLEIALDRVFSCCSDGIVREFSQNDRSLIRKFDPAADWVYCLSIDAASHHVAGGCYNGEIRIWNTETGELLTHFIAAPGYLRQQ